jgi:4-hydroxy-2-oxoheptanedioate aldolase
MRPTLKKNPIKRALAEDRAVFGLYAAIPSTLIVELAAHAGFDFVRIDVSHAFADWPAIVQMVGLADASGLAPMVRIEAEPHRVQMALEGGATGVIVPGVSTAEAARAVVRSVRFPPLGARGMFGAARSAAYGAIAGADYAAWSNDEVLLGIQIESRQAVDRLEEILDVPGIDLVLSGRGDLAVSLGLPGQKNHAAVLAAEERIFEAAAARGIGMSVNLDPAREDFARELAVWKERGVRVFTLGHDIGLIRIAFERALDATR